MPEESWVTYIAIATGNPALKSSWDEVADQLRMIVARCGYDTRAQTLKLAEVIEALHRIRVTTVDMTLPPHRRFK